MSSKTRLRSLAPILFIMMLLPAIFYAGVSYGGGALSSLTYGPGDVDSYSYTVFKEGSNFYGKNGTTRVVDFGPSTNASYIINSCIQAVDPLVESDAGNGIALLSGSYSISAPILLNVWHVRLVGVGNGAPVLTAANGLNDDVIKVQNYSITIQNIAIIGNKAGQTQGSGINITAALTTNRAYILECTISDCKGKGIVVGNVGGVTFEQIIVRNTAIWSCEEDGIYLGGSCYDFKISSCTIGANTAFGIQLVGCAEGQLVNNDVYDNGNDNILVYQCHSLSITGNHIVNSDGDGVQIDDSYGIAVSANTIVDNDEDDVSSFGVRLTVSRNCTATGNVAINRVGSHQDWGIYEYATCGDNIMVANVCSGTVGGIRTIGTGSIAEHNLNQTQS